MRGNNGQYGSLKVQVAKDAVKEDAISLGQATTMYEMLEPVQCRCGEEIVVKIFKDQWFIDYGDNLWKELAHENLDMMTIIPKELTQEFHNVVDWLKEKACARKAGLGTPLPWEPAWIIESLSDSVIYMAYYTVIKGIKEVNPDPEKLAEAFWDYLFLGNGDQVLIAENSGFTVDQLNMIREEFEYFYPMDSRHSGRDLISNHLTYMIFCHNGIWPRELWPKGIVVNGSVLMEGSKMSKSFNNIVPLINAINSFGADPLRLSLMVTAEPLKDSDFSPDLAKNISDNLDRFFHKAKTIIALGKGNDRDLRYIDRWMLSRVQTHIMEANKAMKELKIRRTIHAALYNMNQDLEWYQKRVAHYRENAKRFEAIKYVEWKVLETQVRMLNPFIPHLCEEIWEMMGGKGFLAFAEWPKVEEDYINPEAEEVENTIKNSVDDIQKIMKVTGIIPKKIHFYTADGWKWKIYTRALKLAREDKLDVGNLIREAFKDDEIKARGKQAPNFARIVVEDITKLPQEKLLLRLKMGQVKEASLLQDANTFFQNEFKANVLVYIESDPWIEDPANRARLAKPYRPAIYIE
jgi:leucyl-tRNA synthetase